MKDLSASIVVYRNPANVLAQTIHSFLCSTQDSRLYILDNSPTDQLKYLAYNPRITYIFNAKNVGFGAGHNISLRRVIDNSKYHLVLNPDVYFDATVVTKLYQFMESNPDIGQAMPKVLYPDGRLQPLCKLLPSPKTLLIRRFFGFLKSSWQKENYTYELQFTGYDKIMDVPFLSGCFMFLRMDALKKVGLFDERFFLYTEDTDMSRRIHKYFRTVYYPEATIFHHHQRGSYKDPWLFWCSLRSAFSYFNKWGWTVDEERETFNNKTLKQLSYVSPGKT